MDIVGPSVFKCPSFSGLACVKVLTIVKCLGKLLVEQIHVMGPHELVSSLLLSLKLGLIVSVGLL